MIYSVSITASNLGNNASPLFTTAPSKIDVSYIPSFDERELGYKELITNKTLASRLRLFNKETDNRWALHGHTSTNKYHQLLNQEIYHTDHPDWYADASSDGFYQLCYTAHGHDYQGMVDQMAENLYNNYIAKNSTAQYFMIGQEDNRAFCTCDACQHKSEEYGCEGKVSGLIVLFLNDVIEKVESIMKEILADKRLEIKEDKSDTTEKLIKKIWTLRIS